MPRPPHPPWLKKYVFLPSLYICIFLIHGLLFLHFVTKTPDFRFKPSHMGPIFPPDCISPTQILVLYNLVRKIMERYNVKAKTVSYHAMIANRQNGGKAPIIRH
jgi:hypothetical protein